MNADFENPARTIAPETESAPGLASCNRATPVGCRGLRWLLGARQHRFGLPPAAIRFLFTFLSTDCPLTELRSNRYSVRTWTSPIRAQSISASPGGVHAVWKEKFERKLLRAGWWDQLDNHRFEIYATVVADPPFHPG